MGARASQLLVRTSLLARSPLQLGAGAAGGRVLGRHRLGALCLPKLATSPSCPASGSSSPSCYSWDPHGDLQYLFPAGVRPGCVLSCFFTSHCTEAQHGDTAVSTSWVFGEGSRSGQVPQLLGWDQRRVGHLLGGCVDIHVRAYTHTAPGPVGFSTPWSQS